ncbi:MAG: LolA-related protein [Acetobacteraceae bacterium]
MTSLARLPERRAIFQEQKTLGALDRTLRSSGRLFYRRPGHLEKITLAPRPESVIVDGDQLSLTDPDGTSRSLDLDNQPELRALVDTLRASLSGDLATLRQLYRVSIDGSMSAWRLALVPSDRRLARFLRETVIDGAGTELRAIRIIEANGDEQRMTIEAAP